MTEQKHLNKEDISDVNDISIKFLDFLEKLPAYKVKWIMMLGITLFVIAFSLLLYAILSNKEWINADNFHFIFGGLAIVGFLLIVLPLYPSKNTIENIKEIKEFEDSIKNKNDAIAWLTEWLNKEGKNKSKHIQLLMFVHNFNNDFTIQEIREIFKDANSSITTQFSDLKIVSDYMISAEYKPALNYERGGTVSITNKGIKYLKDENIL